MRDQFADIYLDISTMILQQTYFLIKVSTQKGQIWTNLE